MFRASNLQPVGQIGMAWFCKCSLFFGTATLCIVYRSVVTGLQSWVAVAEMVCPAKPQIFVIWSLTEKACHSLLFTVIFYVSKIYVLSKWRIIQNSVNITLTFLEKGGGNKCCCFLVCVLKNSRWINRKQHRGYLLR